MLFLILALACGNTPLWAQTMGQVAGQVVDEQAVPLPGVNIVIRALQKGVTTGSDGRYLLPDVPTGPHTIEYSFIGYAPESRQINVGIETVVVDVVLRTITMMLNELTVSKEAEALTRAVHSVSVLDARDLDDLRDQTLGDMLERVAGVTTLSTGPAISKPVIRGLHSDRVVVLNAGVRQEGQQWGGEHAPEIDPFSPNRIEVLKGAAGVEYGVGAIGGVIRVEPRPLRSTPGLDGQATFSGFSNNRQGGGAFFLEGGSNRLAGLGWRIQGSGRQAGNARTPNYGLNNSGFKEASGSLAMGYSRPNRSVELLYSRYHTELGIFTGSHIGNLSDLERAIERGRPRTDPAFTYTIQPPKQTVQHDLLTLKSSLKVTDHNRLEVQYGFQQNLRREFDAHNRFDDEATLDAPAFQLQLQTHTVEARLRHGPYGNHFGSVGISGMRQGNINGETGFLIPNFKAYTGGLFARETWIIDPWMVELGARWDYRWMEAWPVINRQFERREHRYNSLSGVAGVIRKMGHHWSVALHVGTGWRPPGVNELYSNGVHHGAAQFEIGDTRLGSERNVNIDATFRHESELAHAEVGVYYNRFWDYISLFPDPEPTLTIRGAFPTFRYHQAHATLQGLDGVMTFRLNKAWELGTGFALVRGQNHERDEPLFLLPSDQLRLSVRFNVPPFHHLRETYIETRLKAVRQQDRVPVGVDYSDPPDGYALVELAAGTQWLVGNVPIRFSLSIHNLFDTAYRDYLSRFRYFTDEPGRSIVFRIQIPFGVFDS